MGSPHMLNQDLKLTLPTDFEILQYMADGKRHQGNEIAAGIGKDDQYVRNRLPELRGHGLIQKVENSTMYVITQKGQVALDLRNEYAHGKTREFAELVEKGIEEAS